VGAEPTPQDLGKLRVALDVDLVDDRTQHPDTMRGEELAVQHDLIDRSADAPLAYDDDRRIEKSRGLRVRETDHRSHARVPGTLDDDDVLAVCHALESGADLLSQVIADAAHHVVGREVARQGDRAHVVQGVRKIEDRLHQDGVLIGPCTVDDQVALANRLHEAEGVALVADRGQHAEAHRRLAPVLACRRQEDAPRPGRGIGHVRAFDRRSIRSTPSRRRFTSSASIISGPRCSPRRSIMSALTASSTSASAMKNWGSLL
jgi:hypothetical protein